MTERRTRVLLFSYPFPRLSHEITIGLSQACEREVPAPQIPQCHITRVITRFTRHTSARPHSPPSHKKHLPSLLISPILLLLPAKSLHLIPQAPKESTPTMLISVFSAVVWWKLPTFATENERWKDLSSLQPRKKMLKHILF